MQTFAGFGQMILQKQGRRAERRRRIVKSKNKLAQQIAQTQQVITSF